MRMLFSMYAACAAMAILGMTLCSSADAQWGTLKGQILLDGEIPKSRPLDTAGKDPAVCGAQPILEEKLVVDPKTKGIANVVIYLLKKPATIHPDLLKSKDPKVKFDQKGCRFIPHVMSVRTDQQVEVLSDDAVAHNTHSNPLKNVPENFVVPPNTRVGVIMKPLSVAERLPVRINCDIHPWMEAYWVVLDHPYAAVTDEQGHYEIPNLPVGAHEFIIWSNVYLEKKYAVTIKEGDNEQKPLKFSAALILK